MPGGGGWVNTTIFLVWGKSSIQCVPGLRTGRHLTLWSCWCPELSFPWAEAVLCPSSGWPEGKLQDSWEFLLEAPSRSTFELRPRRQRENKSFKQSFRLLTWSQWWPKSRVVWSPSPPGVDNKGVHCLRRMKSQEWNQGKGLLAIHQQF